MSCGEGDWLCVCVCVCVCVCTFVRAYNGGGGWRGGRGIIVFVILFHNSSKALVSDTYMHSVAVFCWYFVLFCFCPVKLSKKSSPWWQKKVYCLQAHRRKVLSKMDRDVFLQMFDIVDEKVVFLVFGLGYFCLFRWPLYAVRVICICFGLFQRKKINSLDPSLPLTTTWTSRLSQRRYRPRGWQVSHRCFPTVWWQLG